MYLWYEEGIWPDWNEYGLTVSSSWQASGPSNSKPSYLSASMLYFVLPADIDFGFSKYVIKVFIVFSLLLNNNRLLLGSWIDFKIFICCLVAFANVNSNQSQTCSVYRASFLHHKHHSFTVLLLGHHSTFHPLLVK